MSKGFQSAGLVPWIIGPVVVITLFLLGHYPNVIPYGNLSVVGDLLLYLVSNYRTPLIVVFWAIVVAHAYEAILARRICSKLKIDQQSTLLWTIQTFILGRYFFFFGDLYLLILFFLGFPSLKILKGYLRQSK